MQIILLERIPRLGFIGDEVRVKPGYARNFLLPQKKALRATKENREYFEKQKVQIEAENLKLLADAKKAAKKLEGMILTMVRQAGDSGQLYGSVTAKDIAEECDAEKIIVSRQQIHIAMPIKILGVHSAVISLHPEVEVEILVNVAKSKEEALAQFEEFKNPKPVTETELLPEPVQKNKKTTAEGSKESEQTADKKTAGATETSKKKSKTAKKPVDPSEQATKKP